MRNGGWSPKLGPAQKLASPPVQNWAGNITYSASRLLDPQSVEEAQALIAAAPRIRALGTRHSFSRVADFDGALLSTGHLDRIVEVGERTVTVEAGIRYGELGAALREHGLAVSNFASLPHISVGGAIATATHGSGVRNPSLGSAVSALELIGADGELVTLRRGDADFDGAVVALGALGVVARVTLDVVPEFELRQYVFERLPWDSNLDEILDAAYSVSLFTLWTDAGIGQVWVKTSDELDSFFGATRADGPRHPVLGGDPVNSTEQLGVPGPSSDRLPHFRLGFTPSGGDELQTEYLVARKHGSAVIEVLRGLGPQLTPLLLTSEIRTIAADTYWLSPFFERDSIAFHFTWKPLGLDVLALLPTIEEALAPFDPRPHWGKVFHASPFARYPKVEAFRALRERLDPGEKFRNDFV
jgi:alditol oxidase